MYTKTVLLAGTATATVIASVIVLDGAGTNRPGGQQSSSPQTVGTGRDVTGQDLATAALPWHKSNSSSAAPAALALSHSRTEERGMGKGGAKQINAAMNRAPINEPHGRHERASDLVGRQDAVLRPLHRHLQSRSTTRSNPRIKRAPRDLRPPSPITFGSDGSPSLIAMECDELFPPHKREFRLRNIVCHRLLD
ncbi:hypothetical protein ACFOY2_46865 [Nonomuraea purpurea]|uniref:Secreted protein n=1 Tax=Nonomuraea purpurea TaxID=1849276 RepID=A0ABV8GPA3_9ACTN